MYPSPKRPNHLFLCEQCPLESDKGIIIVTSKFAVIGFCRSVVIIHERALLRLRHMIPNPSSIFEALGRLSHVDFGDRKHLDWHPKTPAKPVLL